MKMKKKGKVYPSPPPPPCSTQQQPQAPSSSSSSSSQYLNEDESLSVLRLLPATILVLVSVLSAEDRQVLAYLITRGTTISVESKKKTRKNKSHKPPVFDCECFDCYTNYWFRWDSSPNRELIHQIIDAFENHHLASTTTAADNSASRTKSKRGKKKDKPAPQLPDKDDKPLLEVEPRLIETTLPDVSHVSSPDNNSPGRLSDAEVAEREPRDEEEEEVILVVEEEEESRVVFPANGHKGLARKVLPDVLGLFSSSFWRLWNPNA